MKTPARREPKTVKRGEVLDRIYDGAGIPLDFYQQEYVSQLVGSRRKFTEVEAAALVARALAGLE